MKQVYLDTFGCQMNVADTDRMELLLFHSGYIRTGEVQDADLVLINTCSIRDKAEQTIGTKAAPKAVHAKTTRVKIVSGAYKDKITAKITTKSIAILALLMFVPLPPFQSRSTDEATAKSWLSAVDMIAERTAAVIIPENTGPKSL